MYIYNHVICIILIHFLIYNLVWSRWSNDKTTSLSRLEVFSMQAWVTPADMTLHNVLHSEHYDFYFSAVACDWELQFLSWPVHSVSAAGWGLCQRCSWSCRTALDGWPRLLSLDHFKSYCLQTLLIGCEFPPSLLHYCLYKHIHSGGILVETAWCSYGRQQGPVSI